MELSVHSDGTEMSPEMDVIFTARNEGNIFRSVCQESCPLGGGACMAGGGGTHDRGACVAGGMRGRRACMVGCVWQGVCIEGGMHGMGCAWWGLHGRGHEWQGGIHGRGSMCGGGACMADTTRYGQ